MRFKKGQTSNQKSQPNVRNHTKGQFLVNFKVRKIIQNLGHFGSFLEKTKLRPFIFSAVVAIWKKLSSLPSKINKFMNEERVIDYTRLEGRFQKPK